MNQLSVKWAQHIHPHSPTPRGPAHTRPLPCSYLAVVEPPGDVSMTARIDDGVFRAGGWSPSTKRWALLSCSGIEISGECRRVARPQAMRPPTCLPAVPLKILYLFGLVGPVSLSRLTFGPRNFAPTQNHPADSESVFENRPRLRHPSGSKGRRANK